MRTPIKIFLAILILVVCGAVIALSYTAPQVAATSTMDTQPTQTSISQSSNGPGRPAIKPSLPIFATVRITSADVNSYLQTHPFVGGPLMKGANSPIVSLQFVTSKQASTLMNGEPTGLADTAMVCYVKLQGPFSPSAASLPPQAQKFSSATYAVEIFDAQTGNLLMWWIPSARDLTRFSQGVQIG
jgi:hypothetical protein